MTATLSFTLRPATPDDIPARAALHTAVWPDDPETAESLREEEESRPAHCKLAAFVAEDASGRVVGAAGYDQFPGMYHPRKFYLWLDVHPDAEGSGVGRALADRVDAALAPLDPLSVLASTREDRTRGVAFLRQRGFAEAMRYFESRLDVAAFDFAPYAGVAEAVEARGYHVAALADFPDDEAHRRRLFDLFAEVRRDVPRPEPATELAYEDFERWHWGGSKLLPEAYFLAVETATGRLAGLSALWKSDGAHLSTGLTGVRAADRRQGLALAMKLRGIEYARARGVPEIRTGNESRNRPMLAINERLGFVKQPAWIDFSRVLGSEEA